MHKFYACTLTDYVNQIAQDKLPLQQKQLYRALAESGRAMIGSDVVKLAMEKYNLVTRQDPAVLAAWYFSVKRRHVAVRLVNEHDGVAEAVPSSMAILASLVS